MDSSCNAGWRPCWAEKTDGRPPRRYPEVTLHQEAILVPPSDILSFDKASPFDDEERACIRDVWQALKGTPGEASATARQALAHGVRLLGTLGRVLRDCPLQEVAGPDSHKDLTRRLLGGGPATFEILLPTRALVARTLVMAEVNFYRSLIEQCSRVLSSMVFEDMRPRLTRRVCVCLYTRLLEEVLTHIASDGSVRSDVREKAVLALLEIWDRATYRVIRFFPLLEATWEARRRVRVALGTLAGTHEVFSLLAEGCDARFVDYFLRTRPSVEEQQAFREFLFGSTTEALEKLAEHMRATGRDSIENSELESGLQVIDLGDSTDPATGLYAFFLARHIRAQARRLEQSPGPKRTAEEYVMLAYLRRMPTGKFSSRRCQAITDPSADQAPSAG